MKIILATGLVLFVFFKYLMCYLKYITRFGCAENHIPQDHFKCVMVCYCTCTPQKTRLALDFSLIFLWFHTLCIQWCIKTIMISLQHNLYINLLFSAHLHKYVVQSGKTRQMLLGTVCRNKQNNLEYVWSSGTVQHLGSLDREFEPR